VALAGAQTTAEASVITARKLVAIMPHCPPALADVYASCLTFAMLEREIVTVARAAAFLGQLAWESGELRYMEEIADGSVYEHRPDLGNVNAGDGPRFKGRGPIQLTGRANYRAAGLALGVDLESVPQLAAQSEYGFRVAAWFWASHGLNAKADISDLEGITRAINGGLSHYRERLAYYEQAVEVLWPEAVVITKEAA
jgi:putative chitinase